MTDTQAFWDEFYAEHVGRWSGRPNAAVVAEATSLAPGTALELGCGDGADAIWLARRGWRVTAVDVSEVALAAAARAAAAAGVAGAIAFERHDLAVSMPAGPFDLVTTAFLHSPVELPRTAVLRRAAERVKPGGTLLVVGHAPSEAHPHADLPTAAGLVAELALPPQRWALRVAEERELEHAFAGEDPHARTDSVVRYTRTG